MNGKSFSMAEALSYGWGVFKANVGFFIILVIVAGLFYIIPEIVRGFLVERAPAAGALIGFVAWLIQLLIGMGLIKIALKFCDNDKGALGDLFACYPLYLIYLAATILSGLGVMVGFVLLIIPGIYLGVKFQFYGYLVVDRGLGPIEAIKGSWEITKGVFWKLFFFGILLGILNVAGALVVLIGLFVTIPVTLIAYAHVYRNLLYQTYETETSQSQPQEEIAQEQPPEAQAPEMS